MGYKLERKVKQTKAVSMWYSQPKRPNFQLKSPVEKRIRNTTASPLVASEAYNYALPTASGSLIADHASQYLVLNLQTVGT